MDGLSFDVVSALAPCACFVAKAGREQFLSGLDVGRFIIVGQQAVHDLALVAQNLGTGLRFCVAGNRSCISTRTRHRRPASGKDTESFLSDLSLPDIFLVGA